MINSISYYKDVTNNKMQSLSVCEDFENNEHCRKRLQIPIFLQCRYNQNLLFKLCLNFYLHFSFKILVVKIFLWNKKIN